MALSDDSLLGPNSWLVDEMYDRWRENPSSVSSEWQEHFANGGGPAIDTELASPPSPASPPAGNGSTGNGSAGNGAAAPSAAPA
ncbi:MAG: hypothetical protein AAGF02_02460, partial [Actinomycetota bacterium]